MNNSHHLSRDKEDLQIYYLLMWQNEFLFNFSLAFHIPHLFCSSGQYDRGGVRGRVTSSFHRLKKKKKTHLRINREKDYLKAGIELEARYPQLPALHSPWMHNPMSAIVPDDFGGSHKPLWQANNNLRFLLQKNTQIHSLIIFKRFMERLHSAQSMMNQG